MGLIPQLTSITGAPVKLKDRFPQSEHLIATFDNNQVIFLRIQPAAFELPLGEPRAAAPQPLF